MISHHGNQLPFCCEMCPTTFKTYGTLLYHGIVDEHIQPKTCSVCSKSFAFMLPSKAHFKEYHQNGKNKCEICKGSFTERKYLLEHSKKHHSIQDVANKMLDMSQKNQPVSCRMCKAEFCFKDDFLKHLKEVHANERVDLFKPKVSAYSFDEWKPQKCPICPDIAQDFKQFLKHMRAQHENKRFHCYICEKSFSKGLKSHMKSVHGEEKLFRCEVCQMKFGSYKSFLKHGIIENHIQPKTCTVCSKIYSSSLAKMEHDKKCHVGGKNSCKFCGGTFIVRKNLLRHKKLQHSAYNFDEGKPQK